jgi:[acyl-carrier-protein] S-malonyltransferase
MKAFVFPGQGAQFVGMGKDLFDQSDLARGMFSRADQILGFSITDLMFQGTEEDLKQTRVTQPAIFLHSVILAEVMGNRFSPDMLAGHSLGEFSALVAGKAMSFEDGLVLVSKRAMAMQKACEHQASTMAAILMVEDHVVEEVCASIDDVVVPANYNSPGQVVISGTISGVEKAVEKLAALGFKKAMMLKVGGAFHSPLMEPARAELAQAIRETSFFQPIAPIYQNVTALPTLDPLIIQENLVAQLTSPVRWTQIMSRMIADGASHFIEVGPGKVLQGLVKKLNRDMVVESGTA